jgi:SecD/SecF fusion protein
VLTRSLIAGLSTIIGVTCLLIFGGVTLRDFAFAMLVGIASGTYSSIFIASPVLTAWKEREPEYRARRERIEAAMGTVPPFLEEVPVAKVPEPAVQEEPEEAPEPEAAPEEEEAAAVTPASKSAGRRSQAEILAEAGLGRPPWISEEKDAGGDGELARSDQSDGAAGDEVPAPSGEGETAEPSRSAAKKQRRQRGRRRKHGRNR